MTDRELMQMALDALELLARYENPSTKVQVRKPRDGGPIVTMYPHKVATEAAVPLRTRLAQPEPEIEPDRPHVEGDGCPTEKAVLQRFWREHQKQEPVAWMYDWYDETEDIDGVPIGGIVHDWISKDYDEAHSPTMGCHNIRPLYTAPPQREWQGLTENEIKHLWYEACQTNLELTSQLIVHLARNIEAKLKEKNEKF